MKKLSLFIGLFLGTLLAGAQGIEQSRLLASTYQPARIEQALSTLTATNLVEPGNQVEYKAGQSVVLQPGFEAKAGSVFMAHTGAISLNALAESDLTALTIRVYPNPFEQSTTITYVLTRPARTSLLIRDIEGRLIDQLVDNLYQEAGRYAAQWKGNGVPAGTYICTLETGTQQLSRRIIRH